MATVYSTRFLAVHAGASATYTVPAGFIAVIRQITAFNASAVFPGNAQLVDGASGGTLWQESLNASDSAVVEVRIVVDTGETFTVSPGADVDMSIHGYLLTLP